MAVTVTRPAGSQTPRPHGSARLGHGVLSDEHLARLVSQGDTVAFSTIYERYRVSLSRYCRTILRHPDDAADALQNTMMAALAGLEREAPTGPLKPWLYRIAHNESIDLYRRRRRAADLVVEIPHGQEPAVTAEVSEQLDALLSDLRVLPERQRGALLMRELAGLDYDQIGRAFATSTVAARKLVYEGRVTLGVMRDGRATDCDAICRQISDGDGRTLRNRLIRAHLDSCEACAAFERSLHTRREQLALMPALPVAGGAIWLVTALGGGAGATKALAGGGVVAGGAVAGTSALGAGAGAAASSGVVSTLSGALAIKCLTVCGALAVAGAGAALATGGPTRHRPAGIHATALISAAAPRASVVHAAAVSVSGAGAGSQTEFRSHARAGNAAGTPAVNAGPGAADVTRHSAPRLVAGTYGSSAGLAKAGAAEGTPTPSTPKAASPTSAAGSGSGSTASSSSTPTAAGSSGTDGAAASTGDSAAASAGTSTSKTSAETYANGIQRLIEGATEQAASASTQAASASTQAASALSGLIAGLLSGGSSTTASSGSSSASGWTAPAAGSSSTSTTASSTPASGYWSLFSGR